MSIQWGIAGPGRVARIIASEFKAVEDAEVVAVGSRSTERARAFAAEFDIPHAHGSYEELVADPDVDALYIGTPNAQHFPLALAAIGAGKAVLVEKSMCCQGEHTRQLIRAARERHVFLMEGMWTRFLPAVQAAHSVVESGRIGRVRALQGDLFSYRDFDPTDRLFAPEMGGGSMLDLGVYLLHFAQDFLGTPTGMQCIGRCYSNGVDADVALQLRYGDGSFAQLCCSLAGHGPGRMAIIGTSGFIEVGPRFHHPSAITVHTPEDHVEAEVISEPFEGAGYRHELQSATDAIAAGATEHELVPLSDTLAVSQTMTQALDQFGYRPHDRLTL
ncbi:MAG: Gfo/Idh/MocA family oxidoreductase [Propionibacteriaceae bacterium]|uniref:Oxidoreductase family, NAD-binding Rossmann fold n=1 Tax=Propionibacterium ruminifibrarum TaxID=1962131 RepID=A0A375I3E4_9ACTN|nr:Gfo/Idh/MocA family oxidoreductase [Propionibacterium ruminifibrarum]MBE6477381.1 Gfo/Idh/MocA family oxidoreductase [Propionibacteriaceae bacterium]SPF67917.1 Oxidoreductase family, NAD-binding Rossmann fold [Propionibacterium ruminifibrarum]